MRIDYVSEFVDLAGTLSYTETARSMLVSESALSRHILALEQELQVKLFTRTSRRVRLTSDGELFLRYAESITAAWDGYRTAARRERTHEAATVTVGTNYFVGDRIAEFATTHPDIGVRQILQGEPTDVLLRGLRRGDCDVAVAYVRLDEGDRLQPEEGELRSRQLGDDEFVAVLPLRHPLASQAVVSAAALSGDHFVSFQTGTVGDEWIRQICSEAGFTPHIVLSSEVGSSLAQFIRDDLGVTFLLRRSISKMRPEGVACVPLADPPRVRVNAYWDATRPLAAPAEALIESLAAGA